MATQSPAPALSRWQRFRGLFVGSHVPAKESMVRDMLALERTYLAWIRTSLVMLSLGVGFLQFDDWLASNSADRKTDRLLSARDLGTSFVVSSPLICGYVSWRYFRALGMLKTGKFPEAKGGIMMLSITVAAATLSASQLAPGTLIRRRQQSDAVRSPPAAK